MKHSSTKALFAQWDRCRGTKAAPEHDAFAFDAHARETLQPILPDCFIITAAPSGPFHFSFAGARLCTLFDADLKGQAFASLWSEGARAPIEDFLSLAELEQVGTVAGLSVRLDADKALPFELILLPLAVESFTPKRMIGAFAPLQGAHTILDAPMDVTSWRHVGPASEPAYLNPVPRFVRKVRLAGAFLLYEGQQSP
jgi:hypothetical protein